MRVDAKAEGPRQSMSWLHTWSSLILGWLLYAIFVTGTLSFFQTEITAWMKPEFHQSIPSTSTLEQTEVALKYLQENHPNAGSWGIQLPNDRQNTTILSIRKQGEDPRARRGGERITIDSATGEVLEARETRGGSFLYRFHFELYAIPRPWSRWIVGIATMFMLVAIISGVITHKKIFKDFFTFRRGKGQRSWLDAHNATAVFALPFHIMITFSGLLLLLFTLMPWGVNQIYENRGEFLQEQRKTLVEGGPESNERSNNSNGERTSRPNNENRPSQEGERAQNQIEAQRQNPQGERSQRGEDRPQQPMNVQNREGSLQGQNIQNQGLQGERRQRGEGRKRKPESQPAPLTNIAPLLAEVNKAWKDNPVANINIVAPNTTQAKIEFRALNAASVAHRGVYETLEFDGVTGKNISDESSKLRSPSIPNGIYNVVTVLHEARGVDLALRWLLFFSGIVGTLMVATGLILWCVKRAPQQEKQGFKSFGYRLVEVLNVAAIIGLPIACAVYFYANRFIPVQIEMRQNWEIRAFFVSWLIILIYSFFRSYRSAWLELLAFASLIFALLPVINFMTGGAGLWNSISNDLWLIASFDLAMWVLALLFLFAFFRVKNHKNKANPTAKDKTKKLSVSSEMENPV